MRSTGIIALLAVALSLGPAPATRAADEFEIDPTHSQLLFKVSHLGVSNNWGRFNDVAGRYLFDPDDPAASSFEVTIRSDSIDTHAEKRDQHLKSPDFFNVKQFPVITLKSKSVEKREDGTYRVRGELNLHGVKKQLDLDVRHVGSGADPWGGFRSGFESEFTIRRSDFGMDYMVGPVGDEVTIFVNIEGVRK